MKNQMEFLDELLDMAKQNNNGEGQSVLGILVIISAIITELRVAELIETEREKIEKVLGAVNKKNPSTTADIGDIITTNQTVAEVFKQLCCIEWAIVEKLKIGKKLLNSK